MIKWLIAYRGYVIEQDRAPWARFFKMSFFIYPEDVGPDCWVDHAGRWFTNTKTAETVPHAKAIIDELLKTKP